MSRMQLLVLSAALLFGALPANAQPDHTRAVNYYTLGIQSFHAKRSRDAAEQFKRAMEADQSFADAYFYRAMSLLQDSPSGVATIPEVASDLLFYVSHDPNGEHVQAANALLSLRGGGQYQAPSSSSQSIAGIWSCLYSRNFLAQGGGRGTDESKFQLIFSSDGTYRQKADVGDDYMDVSMPRRYSQSANGVVLGAASRNDKSTYTEFYDGDVSLAWEAGQLVYNASKGDADDTHMHFVCARGDFLTVNFGKRWVFSNNSSTTLYLDLHDGDASSTGSSCQSNRLIQEDIAIEPGQSFVQFCQRRAGLCFRPYRGRDKNVNGWYGAACAGNDAAWQQDDNVRRAQMP